MMQDEAFSKQESIQEDIVHVRKLKEGDSHSFDFLFGKYYRDLVLFCGIFLKESDVCEDIVQNVFFRLWENRENINIESSVKSYLMTAVRNSSFEEIKHREVIRTHQEYTINQSSIINYDTERYVLYSDLNEHLQSAMKKLPEDLRVAFEMNRFKQLKYREIAEELNVSVRTIENRVSKSLELLRKYLKDFYDLILLFIINSLW